MDTYFAPVKRTERREFKNQIDNISHSPTMNTLLKTMSGLLVILNEDRQIAAMNRTSLITGALLKSVKQASCRGA